MPCRSDNSIPQTYAYALWGGSTAVTRARTNIHGLPREHAPLNPNGSCELRITMLDSGGAGGRQRILPHCHISSAQYPGCVTSDNIALSGSSHHRSSDTVPSSGSRIAPQFHHFTPPRGYTWRVHGDDLGGPAAGTDANVILICPSNDQLHKLDILVEQS